jgi:hypothetical protein
MSVCLSKLALLFPIMLNETASKILITLFIIEYFYGGSPFVPHFNLEIYLLYK